MLAQPDLDGRHEFLDGNSGAPDLRPVGARFEAPGEEDPAEEVADCNIAAALEREVDAALDEFRGACVEGEVEAGEVPCLDAGREWGEERLQRGIGSEQSRCW